MTIGTTRFFSTNKELFSKLNDELKLLQSQAGSGQADLKLSQNYRDVSKLNAAEEKKSETVQFIQNSKRAQTDLEALDLAMDRLQDLLVRLQEVAVESSSDILSSEERALFKSEVKTLKSEILAVANRKDSFGNSLFGGVSGVEKPFEISTNGTVDYVGSVISKKLKVSNNISVLQNFSGSEVFDNIPGSAGKLFSVFSLVDDLSASLDNDLNSGISSNIFMTNQRAVLEFPDAGPESKVSFSFNADNKTVSVSQTIYGNDYIALVDQINQNSEKTGVTASLIGPNQISLVGDVDLLQIEDFTSTGTPSEYAKLNVLNFETLETVEEINFKSLNYKDISFKITDAFEHFSTKRAEISSSSRTAQASESDNLDLLVDLEKSISEISEADLAQILTRIELLMTQKEAAQATFTRISSKSLFDFLA